MSKGQAAELQVNCDQLPPVKLLPEAVNNPVLPLPHIFYHTLRLISYLIDGQCVRVPGFDARLVDVHDGHRDLWTHVSDDTAGWTTDIPGSNTTDPLYLKHLGGVQINSYLVTADIKSHL